MFGVRDVLHNTYTVLPCYLFLLYGCLSFCVCWINSLTSTQKLLTSCECNRHHFMAVIMETIHLLFTSWCNLKSLARTHTHAQTQTRWFRSNTQAVYHKLYPHKINICGCYEPFSRFKAEKPMMNWCFDNFRNRFPKRLQAFSQ